LVSIPRGSFIYILLFIVITLPFGLALIPQEINSSPFSIYNTNWDGLSEFKNLIEENEENPNVKTLIGSTNALNRLNSTIGAEAGSLVIMGPKVNYDPSEAIAILLYFIKGGRLVIADDFGTANDILYYFSLILQAISSAAVDGNNLMGLGGAGTASTSSNSLDLSTNEMKLDLPPLFDPLLPYLQPNHPTGNKLWKMANPTYNLAQLAQDINTDELLSSGFNILQSIVAISINKSVLIDTENYVESPVQPILKPPVNDPNAGTIVAPWIGDWTTGVNEVVANYAAVLTMKVKYPTNFTNNNDPTDVISYDEWFGLGFPPHGTPDDNDRDQYNVTHFETLWVPFGQFDIEIPSIAGLGDLLNAYQPSFRLSALYSSDKSWLEFNVTQAKDVNTISPDPSEWGNIEFPTAAMFPLGFDPASPQLYLLSDPSIFINKYVGTSETNGDPNFDPSGYDNRQFAQNLINLILDGRPGSSIYFDEGHLAHVFTNPILYMGLFFRFLDVMTMFPLLAPFIPFTIYGLARRYAPKGRKAATPLLMTRVEQYSGKSYFAFKMRWLLEYQNYAKGLDLIYRRVRRELTKRYDLPHFDAEIAERALSSEFPQVIKKNITRRLLEIERVINTDMPMTEDQFMKYYLILKEITDMVRR
jgi:hypothetical protein